jgi:hypothetical protein
MKLIAFLSTVVLLLALVISGELYDLICNFCIVLDLVVIIVLPVIFSFKRPHLATQNLADFLRHQVAQESLETFLTTEFSVENLHFYLQVRHFKDHFHSRSIKKNLEEGLRLYHHYVSPDGSSTVNLPSAVVRLVESRIGLIKSNTSCTLAIDWGRCDHKWSQWV